MSRRLILGLGAVGMMLGGACGPSASSARCADVDLATSDDHCGSCNNRCNTAALEFCEAGQCTPPSCEPGLTDSCYTGPIEALGVGACAEGLATCDERGRWGDCEGEILPMAEDCANQIDDNCNGSVDENEDLDGDGFTTCQGDCCDEDAFICADPQLVNPGAFEVAGNEVDDDCDGMIDNPLPSCDMMLSSSSSDPLDYAAAIDLCQTTVESGPQQDLRWGVISAELVQASGSGAADVNARSIRPGFGDTIAPEAGTSLAVLSTGHAAAVGDTSPDFAAPQVGQSFGLTGSMPADWLTANGGDLPNAPNCPEAASTDANDSVMLALRVRVPTNARSFSMSINFLSSEYPEWVCSRFNDFFVVLLDSGFSGTPANPADKNLAIYTAPDGGQFPVGVNLAFGNTGLFRQCENGSTGCTAGAVSGSTSSCEGLDELAGTGFDIQNPPSAPGAPGKCGQNDLAGGGTGWLRTSGNVEPGEIIDLRIAIWDTSDNIYNSVVLIDNFEWSVEASEPGTDIPPVD